MQKTLRVYGFAFAIVASMVTMPSSAHAYLDAGTGSMLLQLLLGGVAGLAIAAKLYWHRFLSAIGLRKARSDERTGKQNESMVRMNARGRE